MCNVGTSKDNLLSVSVWSQGIQKLSLRFFLQCNVYQYFHPSSVPLYDIRELFIIFFSSYRLSVSDVAFRNGHMPKSLPKGIEEPKDPVFRLKVDMWVSQCQSQTFARRTRSGVLSPVLLCWQNLRGSCRQRRRLTQSQVELTGS